MERLEKSRNAVYGKVLNRLDRVEDGNFSHCRHVGQGVWELRIDFGPGYRVYFGEDGDLVTPLGRDQENSGSAY